MISHDVDFGLMSQSGQIAHPSTTFCAVLLAVRTHRHASMPSDLPAVARDNVPFSDISLRRRTSLSSVASNGLHTSWMNPDFGRKSGLPSGSRKSIKLWNGGPWLVGARMTLHSLGVYSSVLSRGRQFTLRDKLVVCSAEI